MLSPSILSKSLVFEVMSGHPTSKAVAPIKTSRIPIGVPPFRSAALIIAARRAHELSKGRTETWEMNLATLSRSDSRRSFGARAAPWNNSNSVTAETWHSPGACCRSLATTSDRPRRTSIQVSVSNKRLTAASPDRSQAPCQSPRGRFGCFRRIRRAKHREQPPRSPHDGLRGES